MVLVWKKQTGQYQNGVDAYLGKYRIGSVCWDGTVSKGNPAVYRATCRLPGIKETLGHYENEPAGKAMLEKALQIWIINAGLEEATDAQKAD